MAYHHFDAGTDTARIGIWDSRFTEMGSKALDFSWKNDPTEEAAIRGELFYVQLYGDGGGPFEVFVNESVPEKTLEKVRTINRRYKLKLESSKATVGGVEDFGAKKRVISRDIDIQPGTYALRCHLPDEEYLMRSERAPVQLKGPWAYRLLYRSMNWLVAVAIIGFLLSGGALCIVQAPAGHWFVQLTGWSMALGILGRIVLGRIPGVKRIAVHNAAKRTENEAPIIFELTSVDDNTTLIGGFVSM